MKVFFKCGRSKVLFSLMFFILTVGVSFTSNAATYFSRATGNWNSNTTWSLTSGGVAVGAGVFPLAGDAVIIEGGFTVTVNVNSACTSIQLGATVGTVSGNAGTLTFSNGTTLSVSGNVQVGGAGNNNRRGVITFVNTSTLSAGSLTLGNSGGTPGQNNVITMSAGGLLTVAGNVVVNTVGGAGNTFTPSTGTVELTATNTLPATVFVSFFNLNINGGTTSLGANITVGGALNVTSGTLNANTRTNTVTGLTTVSGGSYLASTGLQTFNGGILVSGGTFSGSTGGVTTTNVSLSSGTLTAPSGTFNVSGNWDVTGGTFTPGSNTVTFINSAARTINSGGLAFNNIAHTINNTLQLTSSLLVNGTFLNSNGTFNSNGFTVSANGLATISGGTYQASTALQAFNGGLTVSGGVFTGSTGDVTANNVTISSGTLTAPSGTFTVIGDWLRSGGTFTAGSNTVTFAKAAGTQTLNSGAQSFNNIIHSGAGTLQLLTNNLTTLGSFSNTSGDFDANTRANTVTGLTTVSGGSYLASTGSQSLNGALTVSGGTFTGSTGAVTTTTVSLSSGLLSGPTGAFSVSGNWNNTGGTFDPTTGTVTFTGGAAQLINGTPSTQTFGNITVNKTGGTLLTVGGSTTTLNVAAFTQTAGNFTAPATFYATGALTLTAGVFTAGANTNLDGDFTSNGGTFAAGSNTVTFAGSSAKTIAGSNAATATFYDLIVASGSVLFGNNNTARTINISNNFTITGGSFLSGTTVAGAHTINLTGNFQNDGTIDLSSNSATGHRLILLGATKTFGGTGISTFYNLRMSTTASASLNLNSSVRVNGTLDWSANGLIILNASDFTFGSGAIVTTPGVARYIQSDGTSALTGQVIRINSGATANWQFLFPIGTATNGYNPLDLTAATITNSPTANSRLAVKAILSADVPGRLKRTFRLAVSGNGISTTFTNGRFYYNNPGDVSGVEPIASYNTVWYQRESTGIWTKPGGTAPGGAFFTGPTAAQPLSNDTYFFTIGTPGAYGQTWYSYQTGNWDNPLTWTSDGSSFPLYVNPTNSIPGFADNVVIKSANTVTVNVNNITINSINVIGTLDMLASTNQNFTAISGSGIIRIASATDNFPNGAATNFADNAVGGTVVVNGTGTLLNVARTFNNLVINSTNNSDITVVKNNITLNGDLTITQGLLQFEDLTAPANRTVTVNGHVTVAANGGIRTVNSGTRHQFNLYGDFINNGTSYFTVRTDASLVNVDTNEGMVDVNLLSTSRDQAVACNGDTRFYRIEIDKGTDFTYNARISSSAVSNFNLFGYANAGIDGATGANANALGLVAGTVELGNNVSVLLNNNGNYSIREPARLWVNGGTVTKTGGNAVVPYGVLQVSAGTFTVAASATSGITIRDRGIIQVEGGTVTVPQIRTSILGVDQVGSYVQSGGDVFVNGVNVATTYSQFSLTYPGNVFNMSGGTLTVRGAFNSTTRPSIYINSDPASVSVTGGTVVMEVSTNNLFRVNSKAPFWNVTMKKTGGTSTQIAIPSTTSTCGDPGEETTLDPQPLVVLNDLKLEGATAFTFLTNNADVIVGGDFTIENGTTYTPGTNTTTINGAGVSSLVFGNTTVTQNFNNLTINKTNVTDEVVIATGRPTPNAAIQVNGIFTVSKGIFDYGSFITSAKSTITLASGITVGKSASTGTVLLDGASAQTINSSIASIHNIEVNNTNNVTLATNNLTVLKVLKLTAGNFNIGTFKLTLNGSSAAIAGSGFSATKMIQTAANASDGGLEMYLDANETITYPIGVSGKYTPVTAAFTSFSDDGLVVIRPVNGVLQTTNLSGGADILAYYWRVGSSNFTVKPTVSYTFQYLVGDVGGVEANYFPGKVLDSTPFTRSSETPVSKVNTVTKVITFNGSGSGFALEDANYTAGGSARFTGVPTVYYTRVFGDGNNIAWDNANNWTLGTNGAYGKHDSRQAAAPSFPQTGDIAIVGFVPFTDVLPVANLGKPHGIAINNNVTVNIAELRFEQMKDILNSPTARNYAYNFQFRPTVVINNTGTQGRLINAKVSGEGMFWIRSSSSLANLSDPDFAGVDLGAFNLQDSSYVVYENNVNGATYLNMPSAFPNLLMATNGWGNQNHDTNIPNTITVNGDLELLGNINLVLNTGATGDITVKRRLRFFRSNANGNDSGGGGELRFGNTGNPRTVTVLGDFLLGNGYAAIVRVLSPGTTPINHTFNLYGDFIQRTTGGNGFKAGTNVTQDRIHMNLLGATSVTLTNSGGDAPQFYSLTVNKGASIATTASFNSLFTIDGPTDQAIKPLTLQNGLFIINSAANIVLTSGGGDFNIPSTAGLEVRLGTARTTTTSVSANITLDGLLRVSGGTVTIDGGSATDSNYIQYSSSGNAAIEVTGGSLTVSGQIRRELASATGILKYTQSAGTVLVANESTDTNLRGVFEIINPGSQFNHSGGSFTMVRGNGSTSVPSFLLEPGSASITSGSTITIGNANTPAGTIGIKSTVALNNLAIAGLAANAPQVSLYVTPLTVAGNLSVSASNNLNALSRDLTIGGNFTVNGIYTPGNNITTFNNTGAATIGGAVSALSFYNFTKTGSGTLALARDIIVNRDLKVSAGIVSTATFAINLLRHAEIDATITSTSGSGLIFGSTLQQQRLTRSVSGTGTLGIVTINNSNGVIVPGGNGYDFNVSNNLRLQSGVFDIGGSLLSLGVSALITPVNPYSAANLIQTNSSFTDKGVRKQFPLNYTTDFVFPVGQSYYTPVTFNFSSGNTTGSSGSPTITVRPSNKIHPVILDDNVGEPPVINDFNNVLQYYWIISAANVSNTFRSTMTLQYVQPLVAVTSPYSETDYIAAQILTDPSVNPSLNISRFSSAVNAGTNVITFPFNTVIDQRSISGDYFAGVDQAIPANVPTYTTTTSGNVGDNIYDIPVFGGIPNGARVIVSPGDVVTFNTGNVILYETVLNPGAKIIIPSGSVGHSLGTITGDPITGGFGDLEIDSDDVSAVLPAAVYDNFFSCAGGGLIFGGSGTYEILGGITLLRDLTLNGAGDKSLSNNNVTICNNLTINSGGFFNSSNRTITVQNDLLLNNGSFNNSAGTLSISRDLIQTSGTFNGGTGGVKTIVRNLTVNGGTFTPGSGGSNIIRISGDMTVNGAATITSGAGGATGQRFTFGGSNGGQLLTGDFTLSRAFNRLEVSNSSGLTLAGNVTVNSELLLTNGLITPGSNSLMMEIAAVSTPTAGSSSSFVNGKLYKVIPTSNGFVFPIGKGTRWRSSSVFGTFQTGTVVWDMEFFNASPLGNVAAAPAPRNNPINNLTSSDPSILRIQSEEYWRVSDGSATSNGRTARVGLSWGIESDVSANLAQREALKVMSWNGTNWTNNGGTNFLPGHTQTRGTFDGITPLSFSENIVTLGSTEVANPLPISLAWFKGEIVGDQGYLYWKTESELNNDYFEIQRSFDGGEFEVIGKVQGKGTTNSATDYMYEDASLQYGKNYYRLRQVDFDGKFSFSKTIVLEYTGVPQLGLRVFPNPTRYTNINFKVNSGQKEAMIVRLFDLTGRIVYKAEISTEQIGEEVQIKTETLKNGMYVLEVIQGKGRATQRVMIQE